MTSTPDGRGEVGTQPPYTTSTAVLGAAFDRIRADPRSAIPFLVAGVVVSLADWLRIHDPLPASDPAWMRETVSVQYSVFPAGTARTAREFGALVDLRVPYLVGGLALEALVPLAVGVAGWLTITRVLPERHSRSLLGYLGGLALLTALPALLPVRRVTIDSLPLGLLAIVVVSLVAVGLFLLPGFLASGDRLDTALRRSIRAARGGRWTLFWLVLAFGLSSWGLARVPLVGGFLSTAIVGTVQAVSVAAVTVQYQDERQQRA